MCRPKDGAENGLLHKWAKDTGMWTWIDFFVVPPDAFKKGPRKELTWYKYDLFLKPLLQRSLLLFADFLKAAYPIGAYGWSEGVWKIIKVWIWFWILSKYFALFSKWNFWLWEFLQLLMMFRLILTIRPSFLRSLLHNFCD